MKLFCWILCLVIVIIYRFTNTGIYDMLATLRHLVLGQMEAKVRWFVPVLTLAHLKNLSHSFKSLAFGVCFFQVSHCNCPLKILVDNYINSEQHIHESALVFFLHSLIMWYDQNMCQRIIIWVWSIVLVVSSRLDFEYVVKGYMFRKGRMKVTISKIFRVSILTLFRFCAYRWHNMLQSIHIRWSHGWWRTKPSLKLFF